MNLISTTQFVLKYQYPNTKQQAESQSILIHEFFENSINYANFLQQKLADRYEINGVSAHPLNRFIPCDLNGNIFEEPKKIAGNIAMAAYYKTMNEYQQAKDRVLFDGFYFQKKIKHSNNVILGFRDRQEACIGFNNEKFMALGLYDVFNVEGLINYPFYAPYIGIQLTPNAIAMLNL